MDDYDDDREAETNKDGENVDGQETPKVYHTKNHGYLKREIHFTVEGPQGQQMQLRYKANMDVEYIFHQACKKFKITPEEHYVVFNNRELEMSELAKDLDINQNSVMHLYKCKKTQSHVPDIFVSVRIRDCRIGSVFRMTDDVWTILNDLLSPSSFDKEMVPIVVYLKQEFIGEKVLRKLRLKDMGITEGSCLLKFLQLDKEALDQRKRTQEDDDGMITTLESLENQRGTEATADAGVKKVHFRLSEGELGQESIKFLGERKMLAFRMAEADGIEEQINEDYFDLMSEEIHTLFREVTKKRGSTMKSNIVSAVKEELEKLKEIRSGFEDTIIRVVFPDRTCLQSIFSPDERISDLIDALRKCLRNPSQDFKLYVTDPKNPVDDQKTFGDLKMVPVGKLYYQPENGIFSSEDVFLSNDLFMNMVDPTTAKEAGLMLRGESLENFIESVDVDRDSSARKGTGSGAFLSNFLRASQMSTHKGRSTMKNTDFKAAWHKKQSAFQQGSWTRGSSGAFKDLDEEDSDGELESVDRPSRLESQSPHHKRRSTDLQSSGSSQRDRMK